MININSSVIKSIAYEVDSLLVLFQDGSLYSYEAPVKVFNDWLKSESKGRFFNMFVRSEFNGVEL